MTWTGLFWERPSPWSRKRIRTWVRVAAVVATLLLGLSVVAALGA